MYPTNEYLVCQNCLYRHSHTDSRDKLVRCHIGAVTIHPYTHTVMATETVWGSVSCPRTIHSDPCNQHCRAQGSYHRFPDQRKTSLTNIFSTSNATYAKPVNSTTHYILQSDHNVESTALLNSFNKN